MKDRTKTKQIEMSEASFAEQAHSERHQRHRERTVVSIEVPVGEERTPSRCHPRIRREASEEF
jgi:hypothetical protein